MFEENRENSISKGATIAGAVLVLLTLGGLVLFFVTSFATAP